MTPEAATALYAKNGPIAFALIVTVLLLFSTGGAFIAFIKWSSANTVPIAVYKTVCDGFTTLGAKIDDLRLDIAGGHR